MALRTLSRRYVDRELGSEPPVLPTEGHLNYGHCRCGKQKPFLFKPGGTEGTVYKQPDVDSSGYFVDLAYMPPNLMFNLKEVGAGRMEYVGWASSMGNAAQYGLYALALDEIERGRVGGIAAGHLDTANQVKAIAKDLSSIGLSYVFSHHLWHGLLADWTLLAAGGRPVIDLPNALSYGLNPGLIPAPVCIPFLARGSGMIEGGEITYTDDRNRLLWVDFPPKPVPGMAVMVRVTRRDDRNPALLDKLRVAQQWCIPRAEHINFATVRDGRESQIPKSSIPGDGYLLYDTPNAALTRLYPVDPQWARIFPDVILGGRTAGLLVSELKTSSKVETGDSVKFDVDDWRQASIEAFAVWAWAKGAKARLPGPIWCQLVRVGQPAIKVQNPATTRVRTTEFDEAAARRLFLDLLIESLLSPGEKKHMVVYRIHGRQTINVYASASSGATLPAGPRTTPLLRKKWLRERLAGTGGKKFTKTLLPGLEALYGNLRTQIRGATLRIPTSEYKITSGHPTRFFGLSPAYVDLIISLATGEDHTTGDPSGLAGFFECRRVPANKGATIWA